MKRTIAAAIACLSFYFGAAGTAGARPIQLEDFDWGLPLLEVERRAEEQGFRLRAKDITQPEPRLEYRGVVHDLSGSLSFFFTPMGGKLYSITATWTDKEFYETLRNELIAEYGEPREEIPGAGMLIWSRRHTELTIRSLRGRPSLTYDHILLKRDALQERRILRERDRKKERSKPAAAPSPSPSLPSAE